MSKEHEHKREERKEEHMGGRSGAMKREGHKMGKEHKMGGGRKSMSHGAKDCK